MTKHALGSVSIVNFESHDPSEIVTNHKLQGHSFLQWSQSVDVYHMDL